MKILVIVAHPDDEVLGMGGTIFKYSKKGDNIRVVYLATGIKSRSKSEHKNSSFYESDKTKLDYLEKEIESLRNDSRKSCKLLGVKSNAFYDFPDNEMDSVPLLKVVKTIEKEIKLTKPDRIYTHNRNDLNIDHRIIFNAALTACRPLTKKTPELICFEVPSSTEWNYPSNFTPNYFVNIEKELAKKIKAMQMYKNEIRKFPHPRSSEYLKINAKRWGAISGNEAAEALEIIRKIEK